MLKYLPELHLDMGEGKHFIKMTVLMFLVLLGTLWLERGLHSWVRLEVILIGLGWLFAVIILLGISFEARWAWPLATIFFSVAIANALLLYGKHGIFLTFSGILFFSLVGLLLSIANLPVKERDPEAEEVHADTSANMPDNVEILETYDDDLAKPVYNRSRTSKSRKKKAKRKKRRR